MVYRQTPRSESVRAASRQRILHAALKLFGKKGYDATTMQEIVAAAGTSIGNAYFYFGSKDQLVREVIENVTHTILDDSERRAAAVPAGPARIAAMIAWRVDTLLTADRDFTRLLSDTNQPLGTIVPMEDISIARWIPQLAECLPDRDASELPAIATAIWGVNRAFVERAVRGKLAMDRHASLDFLIRWTLRALLVPEAEIDTIVRDILAGLS